MRADCAEIDIRGLRVDVLTRHVCENGDSKKKMKTADLICINEFTSDELDHLKTNLFTVSSGHVETSKRRRCVQAAHVNRKNNNSASL